MIQPSVSSLITSTANQYGLDPALALAVANQESGGNQAAISKSGAIGIFQLMPNTAAGLGINPYDTTQNVQGGVSYLSQLLKQYNGDETLALAAYNAGPGNVAKYGGVPPFNETQSYVSSILSSLGVGSGVQDVAGSADNQSNELFAGSFDWSSFLDPSQPYIWIAGLAVAGLIYWKMEN